MYKVKSSCLQVVLALLDDPNFLGDLFTKFKATSPTSEDWADLVAFLQELTSLSKSLQGGHRAALHSTLIRLGLFEVTNCPSCRVLRHGSKRLLLKNTYGASCVSLTASDVAY